MEKTSFMTPMRDIISLIFVGLIVMLGICGIIAQHSKKKNAIPVSYFNFSIIPPIAGNLILALSISERFSTIGCYVFFIGMDFVALGLAYLTFNYCEVKKHKRLATIIIAFALGIDCVQYMFNPFYGHAFGMETIMVENAPYYRFVPYIGQGFHRLVVYGVFLTCVVIFLVKIIRVPKVYSEKYHVVFAALVLSGIGQTYYIYSRTPIDCSMIIFGLLGVLIFYFTLYHRPLKLLDRLLGIVASEMPHSIFFFDSSKQCVWTNEQGQKLLSVTNDDLSDVTEKLDERFVGLDKSDEEWSARRKVDGKETRYYTLEKRNLHDTKKRYIGSFLNIYDHTENVRRNQKAMFEATHDKLTGLYTKEFLFENIHNAITEYTDRTYWIGYADIKDFKMINDVFGTEIADNLLKEMANWLMTYKSDDWIFGRLGGDTFGVCFAADTPRMGVIRRALSKFTVSNGSINQKVVVHLGLYKVTDPDLDISTMFDRAHLALENIKDEYNINAAIYSEEMREQILWNQKISSQLEQAINERQIIPYLQPIVSNVGKIIGCESLVRWIHPEDGFLPPIKFIPVFEKNGMIADVDLYIWREACKLLDKWKNNPVMKDKFISVNISPKDFYFMDVFAEINSLVKEYDISPSHLRLEITESVMMSDLENRLTIINKFREAGFLVEMDDFGSGYSSLNQLKDMPIDILKIDMKFLSKSNNADKARIIMRHVLHMSDELGLTSLTEGVETEPQYQRLKEMGCHLFQGYYFAKPLPVEEFEMACSKQSDAS